MKKKMSEKILDVDASMQGSMVFKDPVNLRINGTFDGSLDTKGSLTIGENAVVKADIKGENIVVAGEVTGDIAASITLKLVPPARVVGDISTPALQIAEGAVFQGNCNMLAGTKEAASDHFLTAEEVATYLEVDPSLVIKWASAGTLPGERTRDTWRFDRSKVDAWVANGKIK